MRIARVRHAQRCEDAILQEPLVRFAGNLFQNRAQQKISGVAVLELRPRLKVQVSAAIVLNKLLYAIPCAAGRSVQKPGQLRKVGNPRGVREQLTDGYAASRVPAVIRQVLGEMSVQGYLAIVDELQDEHR